MSTTFLLSPLRLPIALRVLLLRDMAHKQRWLLLLPLSYSAEAFALLEIINSEYCRSTSYLSIHLQQASSILTHFNPYTNDMKLKILESSMTLAGILCSLICYFAVL